MGYIAYGLALLSMLLKDTSGLSFEAGMDQFLDKAASINGTIFWILLIVMGGAILLSLFVAVVGKRDLRYGALAGGCMTLIFIGLPIGQFIIWQMNLGMASAWGPTGAVDPVKFWILAALTVLFGIS